MLLIHPPVAKPCEPPAGIARLAGALRGHGLGCTLLDANLEGQLAALMMAPRPTDTWGRRAWRHRDPNLAALRTPALYRNQARYQRAATEINRLLEAAGHSRHLLLGLANYEDEALSPVKSRDLLRAAERPEANFFYPYFAPRLTHLLEAENPALVGFSLNYLSQALCTFAMAGLVKRLAPGLPVVLGGGLITTWLRSPAWRNPFSGLIDHLVAGPGEGPLLTLLGCTADPDGLPPDYSGLSLADYLAPGTILPYAASSGCYWRKCSFCPEKAEANPFLPLPADLVLEQVNRLRQESRPVLLHFLDNALSPALLRVITDKPPGVKWYGFARLESQLADPEFCRRLKRSGCVMLKLGLESGDQGVLDTMNKGLDLAAVSQALAALSAAGIATYIYLLFGTPAESPAAARRTLDFIRRHSNSIGFLNLALFNMPISSPENQGLAIRPFSEADLSIYTDFSHPLGWHRPLVRQFLDREFKRDPAVSAILQRNPPHFTSNHAPFFC